MIKFESEVSYYCKNKEIADKLLVEFEKQGIRWKSGTKATEFDLYRISAFGIEDACHILFWGDFLTWSHKEDIFDKVINAEDLFKPQFKVGDLVQIKEWDEMVKEFGTWAEEIINCRLFFSSGMKPFCGKVFKISSIKEDCVKLVGVEKWRFSTDMIKPYVEKLADKENAYTKENLGKALEDLNNSFSEFKKAISVLETFTKLEIIDDKTTIAERLNSDKAVKETFEKAKEYYNLREGYNSIVEQLLANKTDFCNFLANHGSARTGYDIKISVRAGEVPTIDFTVNQACPKAFVKWDKKEK